MRISGQEFSTKTVKQIQQALILDPNISRRDLSRRVCKWLDWRSPNGQLKDMSCRKALLTLNDKGIIRLPVKANLFSSSNVTRIDSELDIPHLSCDLSDLGEVIVMPVTSRYCKESKVWRTLLDRYHYLGSGKLCGAQIRYVVKSSKLGYLGALAFSSACWALKARDKHIGWSDAARTSNLPHVVGNNRFLIVPTVNVKNLASHVLSLAISRLSDDWEKRYNVRPVLLETFVNPDKFKGTCYKAANWKSVGYTAGRRDGIKKEVFIYPLYSQWKKILCREPEIRLGEVSCIETSSSWVEQEFGSVRLYDNRLKQRLCKIAESFYSKPQASIPEACETQAGTIGAYRFFKNEKVTMDIILTPHVEATIKRIRKHQIVLAPQDTSTLNYTHHPMTNGMGPTNNERDKSTGLILHDTLAFTENGTPLGVLDAQCWARDPKDKRKAKRRKNLPIEQKESMKWLRSYQRVAEVQKLCPETTLVSMGDRESDIYELFLEKEKHNSGPELLIRSERSRARKVDQELLWDFMEHQESAGLLKLHIPRSGSRKARDASLDIRFAEVKLTPPRHLSKTCDPVKVWAVYALESNLDESIRSPIKWMLLTTVPVTTFADAKQRIEWYSKRWGIEVYHRTLKTGCRIKDRQLGTADRIETCLGIDMVVAWRILHLTMLGRENPDKPCTIFFKDTEWKALHCYLNKTPITPSKPPKMIKAVYMVGSMGGHLGRKNDGPPGAQTLWRGLQRLDMATEMYCVFNPTDARNKADP